MYIQDLTNQCDGCKLELPTERGVHIHPDKTGWARYHMCCTKQKYDGVIETVAQVEEKPIRATALIEFLLKLEP